MAKRVEFGSQVFEVPDDASMDEIAQHVFESRATPGGMGVAPGIPSGMPAMTEASGGAHPLEKYNAMLEAAQPFYGAAKGAANTMIGARELARKIPGINRILPERGIDAPDVQAAMEPIGVGQKIGYTGEQVGEFMGPGAAGKAAGELVTVRNLIKQGRTAQGAFTAATRVPYKGDLIKRMLLRTGGEAGSAGLLNEAQGGDFSIGSGASLAGQLVGSVTGRAAPLFNKFLKHRAVQTAGGLMIGGGALGLGEEGGGGYARHNTLGNLTKAAAVAGLAAGLVTPRGRGPIIGSFLQAFDRHEPGTVARGRGARIGSAR